MASAVSAELLDEPCSVELGDLARVVQRLGDGECPWTKQQSAADILFYLRTEMIEVEEVLRKQHKQPASSPELAQELVGELGDVLFDALLLIRVCERDQAGVSLQKVCDSANRKLRRRCAYLFDGSGVSSMEDAEAVWQAAKKAERQEEATNGVLLEQPDARRVSEASALRSQAERQLTVSLELAASAGSHGTASTRDAGAGSQPHAECAPVTLATAPPLVQPDGSTGTGMCGGASASGQPAYETPGWVRGGVPGEWPGGEGQGGRVGRNLLSLVASVPSEAIHTEAVAFVSLGASADELVGWDEDASARTHGGDGCAPYQVDGGGGFVESSALSAGRRASGDSDESIDERLLGLDEWEAEFRSALDDMSGDEDAESDG